MDTVRCFQYAEFKGFCGVHIRIHGDWVGGGILTHGVPVVHHWIESVSASAGGAAFIVPTLLNAVAGIVAGAVVLAGVMIASKIWRSVKG